MLNQIQKLDDFFVDIHSRNSKSAYFCRINGYSEQVKEFIVKYYKAARSSGVVIEGRIPNPDEKNLAYFNEIMGMAFSFDVRFIDESLKKWLPRVNDYQRNVVAKSMYDVLEGLKNSGKNENMLKNAYIKFMCWLYYKFERVVNMLGTDAAPKILYEGYVSNYELLLISILSKAGCDIVLLQYQGDAPYLQVDAGSRYSNELVIPGTTGFPEDFSLKSVRDEIQNELNNERLYGVKPEYQNCTNAWIDGKGLDDIRTEAGLRGNEPKLYYNAFIRIKGVQDKIIYLNELHNFYLELHNNRRKIVIVDNAVENPTMEEIAQIRRNNYTKYDQLIFDLQKNINYSGNMDLQRIMNKSFVDVLLEESKKPGMTVNKLSNKAVYLLCWLKRYQGALFSGWKMPEISCFIYMGGCKNDNEALFMKFLSKMPVDVLILCPNHNVGCVLEDKFLYEVRYSESVQVDRFPQDNSGIQIGTTAYHAERELDTLMYQNTGIYRNQQFEAATSITLKTMYEEIAILWNQEMKYRPNFSAENDNVSMPVIYAKVCGVKDGDMDKYWVSVKSLLADDVILIKRPNYVNSFEPNPVKAVAASFFKNSKLLKNTIKNHASYQYSMLREEMQNYILDKLQLMLDRKIIKGTFENGMEYTVIATVLNMNKELVRIIQKFDFTKRNPKIVYINTTEENISLEDSILMAFLNLLGFDIVFFVPTGYQTIEKYYNKKMMDEHQIGEYVYDLNVPDFNAISSNSRGSWKNKIFKRGI